MQLDHLPVPVNNPQPVSLAAIKDEKSKKIIQKYTLIATGAALVPFDFADVVSSSVSQALMLKELCALYNLPYSDKLASVAFWSITGSTMTKAITSIVDAVLSNSNVEKQFDLTGAAVAGIYMATVGEFYNIHFQKGGTLDNIKFSDFSDYFVDEIKKGDLNLATFTNPSALLKHLSY